MTELIEIVPIGPVHAAVRPPGSKSITNRALICAALANGPSTLTGALDSEDTQVMVQGLQKLGFGVAVNSLNQTIRVAGGGGCFPADRADLFVANSGTTIRFLTALATLGHGTYRLDGVARMRERPVGDLVDALGQLGASVQCEGSGGCPPVVVHGAGLAGGRAVVRGERSSQFLSALLMVAPYAREDIHITVEGMLVSRPYVEMTLAVMSAFGVDVDTSCGDSFAIDCRSRYQPRQYAIEPDASAASYFWGAAAITSGTVKIEGLTHQSLQGDVRFCECLKQMGCEVRYETDAITVTGGPLRGIEVDMNAISDTVQTLAAVALFASGPTTITGVAHIRHKESDRIGDLARELRKLGATVQERSDGLRIIPGKLRGATVDTYRDHRMAMSLALVGLRQPGVVIRDPDCTNKTYPNYFRDLKSLTGRSRLPDGT
jgi:3-phosphoshikimate 1-carboxyvinyltransferase